jgi:hypothetical protein
MRAGMERGLEPLIINVNTCSKCQALVRTARSVLFHDLQPASVSAPSTSFDRMTELQTSVSKPTGQQVSDPLYRPD